MQKVRYKKIPLWGLVRKIASPKLKSPGLPVASNSGDPFILSEDAETDFIENATWGEALKALPAYIKYTWKSGQLKMTTKFMTVGAIGLIINVAIVRALVSAGVDAKIAGVAGTITTIFTNFLINDAWTFSEHRDKRPWLHRLAGYYAASLGTMVLQLLAYEGMVIVGVSPTIAVIASVGVSYTLRLVYIRDRIYGAGA